MHHIISFILRFAYAGAFGYILLFHTEDIIRYIPQLLGGLLMLECVAQLLELFYLKARTTVNPLFFVTPGAVLLYGLILIFGCHLNLDTNASIREVFTPTSGWSWLTVWMKIGGFCCFAFILSEIVISAAFFKPLYRPAKFAEEKAQQREAQRALEAEQARVAALAAQKEKELAAQKEKELAEQKEKDLSAQKEAQQNTQCAESDAITTDRKDTNNAQ